MVSQSRRDIIALTLAIGLAVALNVITFALLYNVVFNQKTGLSDNGTQILIGWGGGILGILGAVFGYRAGRGDKPKAGKEKEDETPY